MKSGSGKKYLLAFVITAFIFATAIALSNYFNNQRLSQIQAIQDKIAIDTLSLETQFDLLQGISCAGVTEGTTLSTELNFLASKLTAAEESLGLDNPQVQLLQKQYSLLEIKDYLLMKRIALKCGLKPVFILYFYSNEGDCDDCIKEGYVLSALRGKYDQLRVYSFNYHLDLSALKTLAAINKLSGELPALVLDEEVYYGFQSAEDIEAALPQLAKSAVDKEK